MGVDNERDLHERDDVLQKRFGKKVKCTAKEDRIFNGDLTEERASSIVLRVRKDKSVWGRTLVQG